MGLFKGYKISDARKIGDSLGREGLALQAKKAIETYDGSYKGAMELCGKLSVLADCATFDDYWQEQVERGIHKQNFELEQARVSDEQT